MNYMNVPIGATVPFLFDSFAGATGASITISAFVVGDVKIFKDGITAQPTPGSGIALLDTDGIDIASMTGIHGFTINTGNTTDSGYFAAGGFYNIIVDAITIDSQTVRFIAGAFRLIAAEGTAGYQSVNTELVDNAAPEAGSVVAAAVVTALGTGASLTTLATQASVNTIDDFIDTEITAIKTKTDFLPSATAGAASGLAIVGSAMTLSTGERDAVADAHLDRANGIETGITPRLAHRYAAAAAVGVVSGAGTSAITIKGANVATTRILTSGSDVDGNRPTVMLS